MLPDDCRAVLARTAECGDVLVMTGAGISAESGIPTFRGPEGYWTVGSRNYRAEELATWAAFSRMPWEIWAWYLYRRGVCSRALPNAAHQALAALGHALKSRTVLITQNVDGLHLRAGSPADRTWHIHGNILSLRCADECTGEVRAIPDELPLDWERTRPVAAAERSLLACPACGGLTRPHVLWMDECYDEERYRFESSIRAAQTTDLLVVIGTSGFTNLPLQIGQIAAQRRIPMVVIDPADNPFAQMARDSGAGWFVSGTATELVPEIVRALGVEPGPRP